MVEYAYKENGVMKLKPVALSLSQSEIDEIATELLEAMQPDWQNAVQLTISQLYNGYTVPANGMLVGAIEPSSSSQMNELTINGVIVSEGYKTSNQTTMLNFQVIVNKGDIAKYDVNGLQTGNFYFVPFKTMNPVSLRPLDPHKIDTAILNHWYDITSDFSIAGSAAGFVLNSVKYNPVLKQLKLLVKKTSSTAASTTIKLFLQYNGSELITFGDNTIVLWNHFGPSNGYLAGMENGYAVMASNKLEIDTYNRNSGNAWAANDTFRGIIWL